MPDIFYAQPTCGEISCDECNERYEKAMERIAALEDKMRELTKNFTCRCDYLDYCNECSRMADTCAEALELLNGGK